MNALSQKLTSIADQMPFNDTGRRHALYDASSAMDRLIALARKHGATEEEVRKAISGA